MPLIPPDYNVNAPQRSRRRICGSTLLMLMALTPLCVPCLGCGTNPPSVAHHIMHHKESMVPGSVGDKDPSSSTETKIPIENLVGRIETTINHGKKSCQDLIKEAEQHAQHDQLLAAARKLRLASKARDNDISFTSLTSSHEKLLEVADRLEKTIVELSSLPNPKAWTKHGEAHVGNRDMLVHYKLDEKRRLACRIEFLTGKELLVPLLAVLIETELYNTWVPRWRFPPVGVNNVKKLAQHGRTKQIIHADLDIPWRRDVVISSTGIEDVEHSGLLGIHLGPVDNDLEGCIEPLMPSPEQGVIRVDFEGCFVFQKCPPNHPVLEHSNSRHSVGTTLDSENLILVGFTMFADAKISNIFPQWIVNFIVRVAIVRIFGLFLGVAEDIEIGRRPDHAAAISSRRVEIYDWIDERVDALLQRPDTPVTTPP